jgi:hypothetical protein
VARFACTSASGKSHTPRGAWVADDVQRVYDFLFGVEVRSGATKTAESKSLGLRRHTLSEMVEHVAASSFDSSRLCAVSFLYRLTEAFATGARPLMALLSTAWDETPMMVRDDDEQSPSGGRTRGRAKMVGKLIQSEIHVAFVMVDQSGRAFAFESRLPTNVQVVDSCTGETTVAALETCWDVPGLRALLSRFRHVVHLSHCDRASSNLRAEAMLRGKQKSVDSRLPIHCIVHKAHTAQTAQYDPVDRLVTGMLAWGLAMRPGGGIGKLREALRCLFRARLEIVRGAAGPGLDTRVGRMRQSRVDLFSDAAEIGPSGLVRRSVLLELVNGDWGDSVVKHYCIGCCNETPTLERFCTEVVDALTPSALPISPGVGGHVPILL